MADLKEDMLVTKEVHKETFFSTAKDSTWNTIQTVWYFLKEELPQFLSNWRTVPRLMMVLYGLVFYETMTWFMNLDAPNNAQAGFVSVIVGAGAAYKSAGIGGLISNYRIKIGADTLLNFDDTAAYSADATTQSNISCLAAKVGGWDVCVCLCLCLRLCSHMCYL